MSARLSQIHPDMMLQVSSLQLREGLVSLRVEAHTVSPHIHYTGLFLPGGVHRDTLIFYTSNGHNLCILCPVLLPE